MSENSRPLILIGALVVFAVLIVFAFVLPRGG
jgi:hypothetical protein